MKPARILLLVVAIVAGGLAAFLATRNSEPEPAQAEVAEAPTTLVLVSNQNIGVGQRLNPQLVEWQKWPDDALRPEYVTIDTTPDAPEQLNGTIARFEIFPGEPIMQAKLVRSDQGYLSAVLTTGQKAVSISVSPETGAGGFIVPNDRVDVVLTRSTSAGERSETILRNVKVLALGQRLGERGATAGSPEEQDPKSQMFSGGTIATLELDARQAETLITAKKIGDLSLVLRSIVDFSGPVSGDVNSGSVRMIRYGTESEILPSSGAGSSQQADTSTDTALASESGETIPTQSSSEPVFDPSEFPAPEGMN